MATLNTGTLYIVSAPSGAGKTSLVSALLEQDQLVKVSISHTTRNRRPGEENGVNYHFVDKAAFETLVAKGDFLEHAEVFGNYYGTSKAAVENQLSQGTDIILEIDWQGAQQVREVFPEAVSIFILPPSLAELERRLTNRGQDDSDTIANRMAEARSESSHYDEYDYVIVNDDFSESLVSLRAILIAQRQTLQRQRPMHQDLLNELSS